MSFLIAPYAFVAAAFSPPNITGLQYWLNADDITASDNAATGNLPDSSGNGFTATQNDTAYKLWNDVLNGHNIIRGVRSVTGITGINAGGGGPYTISSSLMNGKTQGHMFMVFRARLDPTDNSFTGGPVNRFGSGAFNEHTPYLTGDFYEDWGSTSRRNWNPTPPANDFMIYDVRSVTGSWVVRINGTAVYTDASNTVNFGANTRRLMGSDQSGAFQFEGDVAEIIMYDSGLSTTDAESVREYLAEKYGLESKLPSTAPGYIAPPSSYPQRAAVSANMASNPGGSTVTVPLPTRTYAANDIILIWVGGSSTTDPNPQTWSGPNGDWTKAVEKVNGVNCSALFWKRATGSEVSGDNIVFTRTSVGTLGQAVGMAAVFTGCRTSGDPFSYCTADGAASTRQESYGKFPRTGGRALVLSSDYTAAGAQPSTAAASGWSTYATKHVADGAGWAMAIVDKEISGCEFPCFFWGNGLASDWAAINVLLTA